ncbi:Ig heavy chain V-III region NIE [Acipenser ruthenus]|uniref:Ig heavy chain V-III region NIE n=1 Tax=Acipenser ruthenus TaxID=7906 RepID=A0A662YKC6_ACIRT|nr:Ig heavy chain V-III region NIE [Acipenser ruthenus]
MVLPDSLASIVLTQSGAELRRQGDSVSLTCWVSGYKITEHDVYWYRQFSGGRLEFLARMGYEGWDQYSGSIQGRFKTSRDVSNNTVFFQMNNLQLADSAIYYCVRKNSMVLDYWGRGTKVTVLPGKKDSSMQRRGLVVQWLEKGACYQEGPGSTTDSLCV